MHIYRNKVLILSLVFIVTDIYAKSLQTQESKSLSLNVITFIRN